MKKKMDIPSSVDAQCDRETPSVLLDDDDDPVDEDDDILTNIQIDCLPADINKMGLMAKCVKHWNCLDQSLWPLRGVLCVRQEL